jgi:spore germination protein (amino acid permease)
VIREGKFGYHEAISLLVITISIRMALTSPSMVAQLVGTTGWYMTIISALVAAFFFSFTVRLLRRFPHQSFMEIYDEVLGKVVGSLFTLLLTGYLMFMASINLREFTEVMKVFVLPESPPSFIMIVFLICVVVLTLQGLETMARFAKFMVYILGAGFVLVLILSISNYQISNLFPILGYGLDTTMLHGFLRSSYYGEVVLVGVMASSLHGPKEIKRIGNRTLLISGITTSLSLLAFTLVFPYTIAPELVSPMYTMASQINLGEFLQRLDPIFVFLWNFGSFIEVTLLFYCGILTYAHVFNITDKRPLIFPKAVILFCLAIIPDGLSQVEMELVQFTRNWGWVFYFIPPIIVLAVAAIRNKKGGTRGA